MSEFLSYNGIDLDCQTVNHSKRPVYSDRGGYLWTEVKLSVVATYNPEVVSRRMDGAGNISAAGAEKVPAGITDRDIRHALAQPRRTLVYSKGLTEILRSPQLNYACDANNGPLVDEAGTVLETWNRKTWRVRFSVTTWIREWYRVVANNTGPNPNVVLSHTWRQSEEIDWQGYSKLHTQGRAVFDAGRLDRNDVVPDDFRHNFSHPIARGFQRHNIQVNVPEDGNVLEYSFVDVQMPYSFVNAQVVKIECYHNVSSTVQGLQDVYTSGPSTPWGWHSPAVNNLIQRVGRWVGLGSNLTNPSTMSGQQAGRNLSVIGGLMQSGGNAPGTYHAVEVRVFGRRDAWNADLSNVAHKVYDACVSDVDKKWYTLDLQETWNVMGNDVALSGKLIGSGVSTSLISGSGNKPNLRQYFAVRGHVKGVTEYDGAGRAAYSDRRTGSTRGSHVGALVSGLLEVPGKIYSIPNIRDTKNATFSMLPGTY